MTVERALGIASLAFGVPGFIALMAGQGIAVASGALVLAVLAGTGWAGIFVVSHRSPFTVLRQDITLSFPGGRQEACLEKHYTIRANQRDRNFISFRNNSSDGTIDGFTWENSPIPGDNVTTEAGAFLIDVKLTPAPNLFQEFSGTLKMYVRDSFADNTEFLIYTPDHLTKVAKIRVEFPDDSPCLSTESRFSRGAGDLPFPAPKRSPDGDWIEAEIEKPKLGADYKIIWRW